MSTAVRVYGTCWAVSTSARRSAVLRTYIRRGGRRRRRRSGGVRTGRSIPTAPSARFTSYRESLSIPGVPSGMAPAVALVQGSVLQLGPTRPTGASPRRQLVGRAGMRCGRGFCHGPRVRREERRAVGAVVTGRRSPAARFHPPRRNAVGWARSVEAATVRPLASSAGPGGGSWSVCRDGVGCGMSGWRVSRCRRGGARPGCSPGLGVR